MFVRLSIVLTVIAVASATLAQQGDTPKDSRLHSWLKRYPAADANQDGVLTAQEARAYRERLSAAQRAKRERRGQQRPQPSHADVKYGPHERNVFDLWLPDSDGSEPSRPVFVYFHGGGFVGGDKSSFDPTPYLRAGMAVVSGNYRLVDGASTLSPIPLHDAARVIQFVRSRVMEWNLASDRMAVSGSSAGAVIALWIGYHEDLADPDSGDPVARHSTRVKCIVPLNGPTNLDPRWITNNLGGPKQVHGSFPKMFGVPIAESDRPDVRARILESSPIEHVTADDPPTLMIYSGAIEGIPLPESASTGVLIHHAYFGKVLKARLDELGVQNQLLPQTDPRKDGSRVILDWLTNHL